MSNKRRNPTDNEKLILYNQVNGLCPLCNKTLVYDKRSSKYTRFDLAHIYPLNPDLIERAELINEELLSDDPNHLDNFIPLCKDCHTEFDKPRTKEEYRQLVGIKKHLIKTDHQRSIFHDFKLDEEIKFVIQKLEDSLDYEVEIPGEFQALDADQKFDDSIKNLTKNHIKSNIRDYYFFIREQFGYLEAENPGAAEYIATQVNLFYKKQKKQGLRQQEIYENVVEWIESQTGPNTKDESDIMASFYVQNCEVFE